MFYSDDPIKKRLYMRSIRRGIKEMDVLLQRFSEAALPAMQERECALYESFLSESDHDLYGWVSGRFAAPVPYEALVSHIQRVIAAPVPIEQK